MRMVNSRCSLTSAMLALGLLLTSGACTGNLIGDDADDSSTGATSATPGGGATNKGGGGGSDSGLDPMDAPPGVEGIGWSTRYPRLSHVQWENTVRDLLSLGALPGKASSFALDPDSRFDTFNVRTVSANLWLDYQRAAEEVAKDVAQSPSKLAKVVSAAAQDDARAFVTELGTRAFRRPLSEQEIEGHVALFEQAEELFASGDAFANGAELVIRALLQSPHFLYRVETSTAAKDKKVWLNGYEIASRLSYGLWNTMPSAELFAAAKTGELATAEGVIEWTQTMLKDPRAKQPLVGFHEQLFNVASYGTIAKSEKLFPTFTAELAPVLREEARRFFEEIVVTRGASVASLLTTPVTFVNATTAPLYGLRGNYGDALTKVELDPTQRAGVLTQLGFLSKYGSQTQSDPILRGVHISLDVLCSALPAPPNDIPPLPALEEEQTNRQRVDLLTNQQPCAACHETYINPLGFAFESYDAIGQWRDLDNGQPVDTSATYTLDGEKLSFDGPVELSNLLAQSPSVHRCYSQNFLEYVLGRKPAAEESEVLDKIAAASVQTDSVAGLLAGITSLETFRARPEEIK